MTNKYGVNQKMLQQVQSKKTKKIGTVLKINDDSNEVVIGFNKLSTGRFDYKDKEVITIEDLISQFIKL